MFHGPIENLKGFLLLVLWIVQVSAIQLFTPWTLLSHQGLLLALAGFTVDLGLIYLLERKMFDAGGRTVIETLKLPMNEENLEMKKKTLDLMDLMLEKGFHFRDETLLNIEELRKQLEGR